MLLFSYKEKIVGFSRFSPVHSIRIYLSTNFSHWHSMNIVHGMHAAAKSDTDKQSLHLNCQEKIAINKENLCILSETIFKDHL